MRLTTRALAGSALAAGLVPFTPIASTAHAANASTGAAEVISHVTIDKGDPSIGYVQARYSCPPEVDHLWVSVKQNADATADPQLIKEGSGFGHTATTWLQSHPTSLQCDGKNHVQTFQVNTTEQLPPEWGGGTVGYGQLKRGQGYVQFCLVSTTNETLFISDSGFRQVK
jgi:hypothetical protein